MPYNPLQFNPDTFIEDAANAVGNLIPAASGHALQTLNKYLSKNMLPDMPEAEKLTEPFKKKVSQLGVDPFDYGISAMPEKGVKGLAYNYFLPSSLRQNVPEVGNLHNTPLNKSVISTNTYPTLLAHEMGHAVDYATPQGKKSIDYQVDPTVKNQYQKSFSGLGEPKFYGFRAPIGVRQIGHASMVTPDVPNNPASMIATGALTNLLDPYNLNVLRNEAVAHMHGKNLAEQAGLKYNNRVAGAAFLTYPVSQIGHGARSGIQSWLMSQVADKGMKAVRDYVLDPVSSELNPELTDLEKSLEPYGYNRKDYRFQGDPVGADDALINRTLDRPLPIKIEPRFGRR